MEYDGKTKWDSFCRLITAVPALNTVFSDEYRRDDSQARAKEDSRDRAEYRHLAENKQDQRQER